MLAVVMKQTGAPEVLKPQQMPLPEITSPTQVRIRLKAAGVNPIDAKQRRNGTLLPARAPVILGCDGAGVVDAIGSEVKRFQRGDAVYFCAGGIGSGGNYAQYAIVEERCLARKPVNLSFSEAAAAPLVVITAWEALHDRVRLKSGQSVLIHAGAGGVGHIAVQIARLAGARVAATVSSAAKASFVSALGAERPILYREEDFIMAALAWTGGQGVDVAMDNVGGALFQQTFPAVRHYGDLVTLLKPGRDVDWTVARERNLRVSLEIMLSPQLFGLIEAQAHQTWILEQAAALFEAGRLKIHVSKELPLTEAAAAHRLIETGSTTGKIVLVIE